MAFQGDAFQEDAFQLEGEEEEHSYVHGQAQAWITSPTRAYGQAQATITAQYYQLLDTFTRTFGPTFNTNLSPDQFNYPDKGQYTRAIVDSGTSTGTRFEQTVDSPGWEVTLNTIADSSDVTAYFDFFATTYSTTSDIQEIYFEGFPSSSFFDVYYDPDFGVAPFFQILWNDTDVEIPVSPLENGAAYRLLVSQSGSLFRVKYWKLSDPEPVAWFYEATHDGFVVRRIVFSSGWRNASGAVWVDNLTALVPSIPITQRQGQAQAFIVTTKAHGQARASIKAITRRHAQARARIVFGGKHAQARAFIRRPWVHGQARARIKDTDKQRSAQAQALISSAIKVPSGQAQALIDSTIKVPSGQAQAKITNPSYYVVDTFTRTLSGSLGTPDIGPTWIPYINPDDLDGAILDGEKVTVPYDGVNYEYVAARSPISLKNAEMTADIYFNASPSDTAFFPYLEFDLRAIITGAPALTDLVYIWYQHIPNAWVLDSFNPDISSNNPTGHFVLENQRWYKIRFIALGQWIRFKIWDAQQEEPSTWIINATTPTVNETAGGAAFWLDNGDTGAVGSGPILDNFIVRQAATEQFGQAQAYITGGTPPPLFAHGQAQGTILAATFKHAQAQALIEAGFRYAQAQAKIRVLDIEYVGQAQGYIITHRRHHAQAMAQILFHYFGQTKSGQSQALIWRPQGYGQAQALIDRESAYGHGQAQGHIMATTRAYGQAQAQISKPMAHAQAMAYMRGTARRHAQAQGLITKPQQHGQAQAFIGRLYKIHGQAQAFISNRHSGHGNAQALIAKPQRYAQAQARIISFASRASGNAQARILASVTRYGYGQARAYIFRKIGAVATGQAAARIDGPTYLTRFNTFDLPGYYQEEALESIQEIFSLPVTYVDGSLGEYYGLKNKILSLRKKVIGETYDDVKAQVRRATTITHSSRGYTKLYVQHFDRYYLALGQKVSMQKTVGESMRLLDYTAEFEVKPWLLSDTVYTLTGTGTVTTDSVSRDLTSGGWSPVTITLDGTDVTVSGYNAAGEFTGFISVSGTVANLVIDSEAYTATINGENANQVMYTPNYQLYVGPGKTTFVITGATSAQITYQNRWYL